MEDRTPEKRTKRKPESTRQRGGQSKTGGVKQAGGDKVQQRIQKQNGRHETTMEDTHKKKRKKTTEVDRKNKLQREKLKAKMKR